MWKYLGLAGQIGLIIAIPIVILALVGRALDARYGTSPWFLLAAVILSFIVSSVVLYLQVFRALRMMEESGSHDPHAPEKNPTAAKEKSFDDFMDDVDDEE